ncbi:AAA family ATPase [Nocardioides solisilvae]|uniref:AAA family ATPase n=1 Tax=Nocardioides solisilvae TaxID=1542435 RepID=UPI000D7451A4|nr:SMC family ATPase [Nocardioides solisilvae]
MRLHHLSVTAFGPFAGTEEVDFDALSASGLFLLTGPTGAGKTSVLDAVCFALYGDVPGDRNVAKRLRSDQAPAGVAPRVALEATLAGRRFRVVRSPAWRRPKKRGEGTTQQQATVTLTELLDGEEVLLSSRIDEVAALVIGLVGMTMPQFCQVAMLPQGGFQAFLRARADERQAVLQQLFHTGRFARVEGWLRDRRVELHRRSRRRHDEVVGQLTRLSEAAGSGLPPEWALDSVEGPVADGSVQAWAAALRDDAATAAADCGVLLPAAERVEESARRALESATRTAELVRRRAEALRVLDRQREEHAQHATRAAELRAAERAAPVVPLARVAERATWDAAAARVRRTALADELAAALRRPPIPTLLDLPGALPSQEDHPADGMPPSPATAVDGIACAVRARVTEVTALLPLDERVLALADQLVEDERQLSAARATRDELESRTEELPRRLERLRAALASSAASAEAVPMRTADVLAARERVAAHARAGHLAEQLADAQEERRECVALTQTLTEEWLDLREARLQGMAAEIAGALAVGGSCPVCGSCQHPSPASPSPGAPDAEAERLALRRVDDAKATQHVHDERVQQLRTALEVARATAGHDDGVRLAAGLRAAEAALAEAEEARSRAADLEAGLADLEARLEQARGEVRAAVTRLAALEERRTTTGRELDSARAGRDAVLAGTTLSSVSEALAHLRELEALVERTRAAEHEAADAGVRAAEHERALARCLAEHDFPGAAEALAAHRPADARARLRAEVDRHRDEETRCRAVLEEPEVAALADDAAPDLPALEARHAEASSRLSDLRSRHEALHGRADRLALLVDDLDRLLAAWRPLREEHRTVSDLAAFVEGKSTDNRFQMRLSAYVLAYRLSQVVAAANTRLARMSDQRYTLEHTGDRVNRETRGGLGLLVRDDWSGESRDPATLSGGETFVVSLALALGLADVITEEAGGADLDTLFVDEGFGSLDADTLDDVLDTLDALRDRGRVVGVVSHVTEMRERIPAQLRVHKTRTGSTLSTAGL